MAALTDTSPVAPLEGLFNNLRTEALAATALLQVNSATVAALPSTGNWVGRLIYVTADKCVYSSDGATTWTRVAGGATPYAMAAGTGSFVMSGVNSSFTISLPAGRFTASPIINVMGTVASNGLYFSGASTSTTSAGLYAYNGANGLTAYYQWTAIQMTSTSAAG